MTGAHRRPRLSWPIWVGALIFALGGLALWRWGAPVVAVFRDQERIRAWMADFGPVAPLISVALSAAQVLLAPLPGQVIGLTNGYLFGVFWGTVYSLIGVTLGSGLAMGLGRWLGRPVIERLVDANQLTRWDNLVNRRGPLLLFLVFLLPLLPDDMVCFAVGLSSLSIPFTLLLATIGRLPGLVAGSWLGDRAGHLSATGWALIGGGATLLALVVLRYQAQMQAALLQLAGHFGPRERRAE